MKQLSRLGALVAATLVLAMANTPALAHDDATMKLIKPANGGELRMAGNYHFELVVDKGATDSKDSPVLVYVTDHAGTKIPTAGASGNATILAGKKKSAVVLQPDGENRMRGGAKYLSDPDMKVLISVTLAGKPPEQTRFTPLAPSSAGHADHNH